MRLATGQLEHEVPLDAMAHGESAASIDAWLNIVSRLMHLPETTRQEICSELREHLRERVRDLLLSGIDEADALRQAIDELGEAAQLARRYEVADRPRTRRLLMNTILTLAGAAAIAAGVLTFNSATRTAPSLVPARYENAQAAAAAPVKSLADARCTIGPDTSLRDALQGIVAQAKVGLMVDWGRIDNEGVDVSNPLGMSFADMPGPQALTLIAQAGHGSCPLDWRMRDNNMVEFGVRNELDRREIELMTYDISDTLQVIAATSADQPDNVAQEVMELLTTMVEPDNWVDNGGDLARMKLVGGRLFVQAPTRMQARVQWILEQLPQQPAQAEKHANTALPIEPVRRLLNPGDTVTVSIFELYQPDTWASSTRQIDEIGMFRVAELGDIRAAGRTIDQLTAEIAQQLQSKAVLKSPKVDVTLGNGIAAR